MSPTLNDTKFLIFSIIWNLWSVFLSASLNIIARLYGSSPDAQPQLHIRIVSVGLITSSKLGITFCIKNCQTCLSRENLHTRNCFSYSTFSFSRGFFLQEMLA